MFPALVTKSQKITFGFSTICRTSHDQQLLKWQQWGGKERPGACEGNDFRGQLQKGPARINTKASLANRWSKNCQTRVCRLAGLHHLRDNSNLKTCLRHNATCRRRTAGADTQFFDVKRLS